MVHTREQNQEEFPEIWQKGICVHGLGKLSTAMSSVFLRKAELSEELKKLTPDIPIVSEENTTADNKAAAKKGIFWLYYYVFWL